MWVGAVIEDPCQQRMPNEEDPCPFRWKLLSRALQIFLSVLMKVSHRDDSPQSAASTIMNEMLSRSVLLQRVLAVIYEREGYLDAARALDEFSASEARKAAKRLLAVRPATQTSGAYGLSAPITEFPLDTWGWWRQRSVILALAVLNAVAKREGEYIETWHTTTRKQVGFLCVSFGAVRGTVLFP